MCLICVAGCDLYLAPQVTDNLTGVVVEYEYLVLRISHPGQVRVDSFVVAAFSGQHVQNLLVRRGIAYLAGIVIGVIIGSDKIDKLMGQLYVFRVGGNYHGIVPQVGSALRQVVAHVLIFRHNVSSVAGIT